MLNDKNVHAHVCHTLQECHVVVCKYVAELDIHVLRRAASWVADVGPGDMLVIPPFWFHHVETLEQSVSVNVWSDAPEYSVMNRM